MKVKVTWRERQGDKDHVRTVEAPDTCTAIMDLVAEVFPRGVRPVRIKAEVVTFGDAAEKRCAEIIRMPFGKGA